MKFLSLVLCLSLLVGCASPQIVAVPVKKPNEIILEQIRDNGISAWESERGVEIFLPDLLFDIDKADLSDRAKGTIQVVADIVSKDVAVNRNIIVSGHADATGSEEWNYELSKKRAMAVVNVLLASGISEERIDANWFGETQPKVQNYFADGSYNLSGQSINRRVEIVILNAPLID